MRSIFVHCLRFFFCEVNSQSRTHVSKCTRNYGELPLNVIIENCDQQPCKIRQNSTAKVHVEFIAPHYIQSMTTFATAYVTFFGFPKSIDLGDYKNTCNYLENSQCPIYAGEFVHLNMGIHVEAGAPEGLTLPVELFMVDQDNKPLGCIRVQIEIVKSNKELKLSNINVF
ncbi:uncharacterized protein LOC115449164 [Manduca sexta]|uniref:uncharacterized protein LOC115449164 n=1 Tax=Manduca sexta TaxID=7130 RepID=UPI0011833008|nr:uncharacterized protein LOC115449164 [Manduca sexta]